MAMTVFNPNVECQILNNVLPRAFCVYLLYSQRAEQSARLRQQTASNV